jgi:hypothetical protein
MVKSVDLDNYRLFATINLKQFKDWDNSFRDVSKEDQIIIHEACGQFSEVSLAVTSSIDWQVFKDYLLTDDELNAIPRNTMFIPADIPSVDVSFCSSFDLMIGCAQNESVSDAGHDEVLGRNADRDCPRNQVLIKLESQWNAVCD